jgi:hypothetical protein
VRKWTFFYIYAYFYLYINIFLNQFVEKKRRKIVRTVRDDDSYPLSPIDMVLRSRFGFTSFRPGQRCVYVYIRAYILTYVYIYMYICMHIYTFTSKLKKCIYFYEYKHFLYRRLTQICMETFMSILSRLRIVELVFLGVFIIYPSVVLAKLYTRRLLFLK